jgi:hypothetical protein
MIVIKSDAVDSKEKYSMGSPLIQFILRFNGINLAFLSLLWSRAERHPKSAKDRMHVLE